MSHANLCTVTDLQAKLSHNDLVVVDASWYMPTANIDSRACFSEKRIKGAVFFDIDEVCDQTSLLPHMLPSDQKMGAALTALGIENESEIVIYDTSGLFSAARVWWMLKLFGHHRVSVLDGGLPAWREADGAVDRHAAESAKAAASPYQAKINETFLADKDVLIKNNENREYLVLDARSKGRFSGSEPEPRAGLASGHMPHSKSLPFNVLIDNGRLKSPERLRTIFADYGLNPESDKQAIITSCGSGVTAAIITLALNEAGFSMHKLYDGAWAEWASASDTIILQGE